MSINNPQLYLVKGTSSILLSTVTTEEKNNTKISFLSFGKNKDKLQNQILIVTRAESISFKALVADLKKIKTLELHREFSAEDKAKFPNNEVTMEEVFNHVKPYSFFFSSV